MIDGPTAEQRTELNQVAIASGLGCSIVVSIVLTIGGGVLLDRALGTSPVLTLIGVGLGLLAAGYQLFELAQLGQAGRRPPPLTRGLARLRGGSKRIDGQADREVGDSSERESGGDG